MQADPGTVYLLHFNQPIGNLANVRARAQHYYGWAAVLMERIGCHTLGNGNSAKIIRYVQAQGIGFQIALTWTGDRGLERRLKRRKDAPRVCPVCKAARRLDAIADARTLEVGQWPERSPIGRRLRREATWWRQAADDVRAGRRTLENLDLESLTAAAFHETRRARP